MFDHDRLKLISLRPITTGNSCRRKWTINRISERHIVHALVFLLLLLVAESSTARTGDDGRQQLSHRYAGEHIHVGPMPDGDCPVKPPCYCTDSVTTSQGARSTTVRSPWTSRHRDEDVVVVAQRISCVGSSDVGRSRRKWPRRSGSRSRSGPRSLRRFPRFVESNDVDVERHVLLSYSGLTSIPGAAFHAIKVVELDLQGNNFGERISPKAFVGVGDRLMALNLAWSNVTRLSGKVFRGLKAVRNISLAENHIRRLPSIIFDDLHSIERLTLAGNAELDDLPRRLFRHQHASLQYLDVGYCQLSRLPSKVFRGLTELRRLDLRGNDLHQLEPFTFADLRSLDVLLLGHNPLRLLASRVFYGLANLTVLRVEESRLEHIDYDVFRDVRRLETLDLADNRLSSLPPGTLLVPALRELSLDGNRLQEIPADIGFLRNLRHLDVSYNRLKTVDRCLFAASGSAADWTLDYVNLRQNPFHCDCELFWLRALRAGMMSRWADRRVAGVPQTTTGRRIGVVPFVPGKCWTPSTLRGIAVTNWLDLDCLSTQVSTDRCNRI